MTRINHIFLALALSAVFALQVWAQQVEYFWDTDPGVGKGQLLQTFTGTAATITTELDVSTLSVGIHQLGLRVLNDTYFSATYYRMFYIPAEEEQMTRLEYGWDKAPVLGEGTPLAFTPGTTVNLSENLSTEGLSEGIHTLHLRALSTNHHSQTYTRTFYIPATSHVVQAIEYFFDEDPGVGNATRMAATTKGDSLNLAFNVDTEGLTEGVHRFGIRTLTDGTWSATKVRQFLVRSQAENHVTRLEYFWDVDPGAGEGYVVDITSGREVTVDFMADMYGLSEGTHKLGLRAQTGSKGWSTVNYVDDISFEGWDQLQDYLNSLRDTEDIFTGSSYTRQFLNKEWHALYVPFPLSHSKWVDHFDVARINAFYQYDDDDDGVIDRQVLEAIMVRPGNGSLKANYPYLIRSKTTDTFSFEIDPSKVVPEEENSYSCSTMEARYTFTGNYGHLRDMKSACIYRLRAGTLTIPDTDDEVLPPYRWYLTIDDLGNQLDQAASRIELNVVGEGEVSDISEISNLRSQTSSLFDLQGRLIPNSQLKHETPLRKGFYIKNGKKLIVK